MYLVKNTQKPEIIPITIQYWFEPERLNVSWNLNLDLGLSFLFGSLFSGQNMLVTNLNRFQQVKTSGHCTLSHLSFQFMKYTVYILPSKNFCLHVSVQ